MTANWLSRTLDGFVQQNQRENTLLELLLVAVRDIRDHKDITASTRDLFDFINTHYSCGDFTSPSLLSEFTAIAGSSTFGQSQLNHWISLSRYHSQHVAPFAIVRALREHCDLTELLQRSPGYREYLVRQVWPVIQHTRAPWGVRVIRRIRRAIGY